MTTLPEVRVGSPIRHQALTVFPLYTDGAGLVDYLLSDEAIGSGTLTVEEVNEGGSVPNLLVDNKGDQRVLFIEGEQLKGAKQNRVLNTSVLVAAHSKTLIPVSCVEQGRWRYTSKTFTSGGDHSSSKLRSQLKASVTRSLKAGSGHRSDQGSVWGEVSRQAASFAVASPSAAMSDTYDKYEAPREEFREKLKYAEGASGVAVAVGSKVVAVDVFDKPATCRKVWDRLLSGVVMDALEAQNPETPAEPTDVSRLLEQVRAALWEPAKAVAEGEEFRSDSIPATHASSLAFENSVLHGSVAVES